MLHLWCYDQKSVDEDERGIGNGLETRNIIESTRFSCAKNLSEGKAVGTGGQAGGTERRGTDVDWAGEAQPAWEDQIPQQERDVNLKPSKGEGLNTGWSSTELLHDH